MEGLIEFFLKAGEVKRLKQRGLVLRGVKDPARIGEHSFREALMGWILANSNTPHLNSSRVIKMTLLHDLARGYAGDITPYEPLIWKSEGQSLQEMYQKWVRLPKKEKVRFFEESEKKEQKAFQELLKYLPNTLSAELQDIWEDYRKGSTREAKFVYQLHVMENFLQALEYWKEDKNFPIESWWHQAKEAISEPTLLTLLENLDSKFYGKHK